jgi:hypothetical protein
LSFGKQAVMLVALRINVEAPARSRDESQQFVEPNMSSLFPIIIIFKSYFVLKFCWRRSSRGSDEKSAADR